MTRQKGIILSIIAVVLGYLSLYLAWGIVPESIFNTIALFLGIAFIIFGMVLFIASLNKN